MFISVILNIITACTALISIFFSNTLKIKITLLLLILLSTSGTIYISYLDNRENSRLKKSINILVRNVKADEKSRLIVENAIQKIASESDWYLCAIQSNKKDGSSTYYFVKGFTDSRIPSGLLVLQAGTIMELVVNIEDIDKNLREILSSKAKKLSVNSDLNEIFYELKEILMQFFTNIEAFPSPKDKNICVRIGPYEINYDKEFLTEVFNLEDKLRRNFILFYLNIQRINFLIQSIFKKL